MDQTPKSKVKKVNALHQKQKVFRQSDPILAVLMWGINHTVRAVLCGCVVVLCWAWLCGVCVCVCVCVRVCVCV